MKRRVFPKSFSENDKLVRNVQLDILDVFSSRDIANNIPLCNGILLCLIKEMKEAEGGEK